MLTCHNGKWYDFFCYCLGEDKFLTVTREDVRASKDWDGNKWVDVANPKNKDDGDSMDDGDSKDVGDNKDAGKKAKAVSEDGNEYANDLWTVQ